MLRKILTFVKQKKILLLILLVAVFIGGYYFYQSRNTKTPEIVAVERKSIRSIISSSGKLQGKQSAYLKFKYSGKIGFINVKANDSVKKFQTLAGLDVVELQATLQQAYNDYRSKQSSAEKAVDDVKNHEKDETYTQREARTKAEALRDSAFDAVKSTQQALNNAYITAPFVGIISEVNFYPGQFVSASDQIITLVDWSEVIFEAEVDEADISKIKVGQSAEVTLNSYSNQIFQGIVNETSTKTQTNSSGATVIIVKINLGKPNINLISDLNGQAEIIIKQKDGVLSVPLESVTNQQVYIFDNNTPKQKTIEIGLSDDSSIEVISGLSEGDQVVKNPAILIKK